MVYHGQVKDGVVVFRDGTPPEGAVVRVEVEQPESEQPTVWDKLRKYSGSVTGLPSDMARNHDHYIHGG